MEGTGKIPCGIIRDTAAHRPPYFFPRADFRRAIPEIAGPYVVTPESSTQRSTNRLFTDDMSPDPMPLTNARPISLQVSRMPLTPAQGFRRADGPGWQTMIQGSPAGAQPVFTRLSAFIRTFVRSKEPAAVAG